jgi:hypothetical protein
MNCANHSVLRLPFPINIAYTLFIALQLFDLPGPCYYLLAQRQFFSGVARLLLRSSFQCRWGVVQLVGHLTVNEDGEGSNPSAPAKFLSDGKFWVEILCPESKENIS